MQGSKSRFLSRGVMVLASTVMMFCVLSVQASPLSLSASQFSELPGWHHDNHVAALSAFKHSCQVLLHRRLRTRFTDSLAINSHAWRISCEKAQSLHHVSEREARDFFQEYFLPVAVWNHHKRRGFFTGYYSPTIHASLTKHGRFTVPIYGRPDDLPRHAKWYFTRQQINHGFLHHHAKVLLWTDSLIERFFMQVQGTGVALLEGGKKLLLGYDGSNGRPFTGIGRWLVHHGLLKKARTTQSLKHWLSLHPGIIKQVFNHDAAFIFYKLSHALGALGVHEVLLTPQRSLAVDLRYIPFGAPLWLSTWQPAKSFGKAVKRFQHLLVAQDTGSAIRGPIRGDIYWGYGKHAASYAGREHNLGKVWILLPRGWVDNHLLAESAHSEHRITHHRHHHNTKARHTKRHHTHRKHHAHHTPHHTNEVAPISIGDDSPFTS